MAYEIGPISPARLIQILSGTGIPINAQLVAINAQLAGILAQLDNPADPMISDVSDRAARLLGTVSPVAGSVWDVSDRAGRLLGICSTTNPVAKAALFNSALPAAEAALLGADITPTTSPSILRIYVCVTVAGIFRVVRTVGGVAVVENLNSGNALTLGASYMFDIEWRTGDAINFRYSVTAGTMNVLRADEVV